MKRENYNSRMSRLHDNRSARPSSASSVSSNQADGRANDNRMPRYNDQENEQAQQRLIDHGQQIHSFNVVKKRNKRHKVEKTIGIIASFATIIACVITFIGYRQNSRKKNPASHNVRIEKVYNKTNPNKNSSSKSNTDTDHDKPDKSPSDDSSNSDNDDKNAVDEAKQEQKDEDRSNQHQQDEQEINDAIQKSQRDAQDTNSSVKDKLDALRDEAKNGTLTSEAKNDLNNIHDKLKGYEQSNTPSNNPDNQNADSNASSNNQ